MAAKETWALAALESLEFGVRVGAGKATLFDRSIRSGLDVLKADALYGVPKLWTHTIEEHRREVREAVLDTTATLVAAHGALSVTMSRIAAETGIGRATLYKYFADVESILFAWHERQIAGHLAQLAAACEQPGDPGQRLATVLEAYAFLSHDSYGHHDTELAALLHLGRHVADAEKHLRQMVLELVTTAAAQGDIRDDISPQELVTYSLYALTAASQLPSKAAVRRLVAVTLAGMGAGSGRR